MPFESMGSCFAKGSSMLSPFRAVKDIFLDALVCSTETVNVYCWNGRRNTRDVIIQEKK